MAKLKIGKFEIETTPIKMSVNGLSFAPAESKKIKSLVSLAGSMASLEALPAQIVDEPFRIKFHPNGTLTLERTTGKEETTFEFADVDNLIQAISELLKVANDERLLRPQPRSTGAPSGNFDDTFEGAV